MFIKVFARTVTVEIISGVIFLQLTNFEQMLRVFFNRCTFTDPTKYRAHNMCHICSLNIPGHSECMK